MSKTPAEKEAFKYINELYGNDVLTKEQWSRLSEKVSALRVDRNRPAVIESADESVQAVLAVVSLSTAEHLAEELQKRGWAFNPPETEEGQQEKQ